MRAFFWGAFFCLQWGFRGVLPGGAGVVFRRVGRRILDCWRRLRLVGPKWRQLRIKVGGVGSVELDLDSWVDESDDGGVEVVYESVLGDFLIEEGVQKR